MTIFGDAREGILIGAKLDEQLTLNPTALEDQDSATGWTLLATAVVSGFPEQVKQLLRKGADASATCRDGETPLLLAAWKTTRERPLIVQMLLRRLGRESIDATCAAAENNTPLMCAVEKGDIDTVRLLRRAGASLRITNDDGLNAKEVSEIIGKKSITRALDPDKDQRGLARVADTVISFVLYVVAQINGFLNGVMELMFGLRGEDNASLDQGVNPGPEKPTPEQFLKNIDTFVKNDPVLNIFFKDKKDFIQAIAQKSVDLANDPDTDLGSPELLPKTVNVSLHQQVIYCDDSGSMTNAKGRAENRWGSQKTLAMRIARITTRILPDGEGVALRFINQELDNSPSLDTKAIEEGIDSIAPRGNTNIGTTLRDRILRPLVYSKLSDKSLERPLLVSIITDGAPEPEDYNKLADVIVECGNELMRAGLPRESVKFLIGQVGSANAAARFLTTLVQNDDIIKVSHIFAGRLDDKFSEFRSERNLDRWLIETLFKPLTAAESKKEK